MNDSQVYTAPTVALDDLTIFGSERAPVGRYRARLIASEVKQTKKGDDYVNAIWEIQDPGEWNLSEFPIPYYTKTTVKEDKKGRVGTYSSGIGAIVQAFAAAGITLSDVERKTFPTGAQKIANLYAKKFGRKVYDIAVYEESYDDKESGERKVARKARVVKSLPPVLAEVGAPGRDDTMHEDMDEADFDN
jgi:hypothetical protein